MTLNIVEAAVVGDKMLKIFWFVLLFSSLSANQNNSICLEQIIGKLFFRDNFIYPFHDLKPMAYASITKPTDVMAIITHDSHYFAWEKIKLQKLNDNYLLVEEPSPYSNHDVSIFFINKCEFIKCINQNLTIFKEKLDSNFNPLQALEDLSLHKATLRQILKNNEILLGILLGYGEPNSRLYCENIFGHPQHFPKKIQHIDSVLVGPEPLPLSPIYPCCCMGTKNGNEFLNKKFCVEYKLLSQKYSSSYSINEVINKLLK